MEQVKWPQNPGTYDIGDVANPVVLICPAQDKNLQEHAISAGVCATGPCLTPRGVELLITNVISNPNIRYIILAGKDSGHLTGDLIDKLYLNGVDQNRKVIGALSPSFPYLPNISLEAINRFREQVEIVNIIGMTDPTLVTLIIRLCLQEPKNAYSMCHEMAQKTLIDFAHGPKCVAHILFDRGSIEGEPMVLPYSIVDLQSLPYEMTSTVGATIYASNLEEGHKVLVDFIKRSGIWVRQESNRMALDALATTVIIEDIETGLYPANYRPVEWVKTDEQTKQYLKSYRFWNYLVPWSNVIYDLGLEKTVPAIPDQRYIPYSYGTRISAKGMEYCNSEERAEIIHLVKSFQEKHYTTIPSFHRLMEFYEDLATIQKETFNQILAVSKACTIAVSEEITGTYRPYLQLQLSDDLRGADPRLMHNPCYAMYVPFFRKAYYREYNKDGITRRLLVPALSAANGNDKLASSRDDECKMKYGWLFTPQAYLRAHDWFAFPANVHGSIALSRFILWKISQDLGKRIPFGFYSHHASSIHLVDYSLDKATIEALSAKTPNNDDFFGDGL
jgi:tetrahydromethanopterin S-methyltransferase subunit A